MINLPFDIQLLIFSFLVASDKLECMTVCRQWHDSIHDHSLFRVIFIHSHRQLYQLIEKLEEDPSLGMKVENLTLRIQLNSELRAMNFQELFPKLREFATFYTASITRDIIHSQSHQSHTWCERLEKMVEHTEDRITRSLLYSGICKHLTYISVGAQENEDEEQDMPSLIEVISNAPTLKTLHMEYYKMSFHLLELLHEKIPFLNSLLLENIYFDNVSIPLNIKPATSVKCFEVVSSYFDQSSGLNPHILYLRQKYTHVERLALHLDPLYRDDDGNHINSFETQRALIKSYMKILGPRLKVLSLSAFYRPGIDLSPAFDSDILDECDCQVEKLNLYNVVEVTTLEQLGKSVQARHIQSLGIEPIGYKVDETISLKWLGFFKALKTLTLQLNKIDDLTEVLKSVGGNQLDTLRLKNMRVKFNDSIFAFPSIKNFTLSNVVLGENLDSFISRSFPNLKRLILENCRMSTKTLVLPNIDLSYLEISYLVWSHVFPLLITTLANDQQRVYNKKIRMGFHETLGNDIEKSVFTFPSVSSRPFDASNDVPISTIVCRSVYNVSIMIIND